MHICSRKHTLFMIEAQKEYTNQYTSFFPYEDFFFSGGELNFLVWINFAFYQEYIAFVGQSNCFKDWRFFLSTMTRELFWCHINLLPMNQLVVSMNIASKLKTVCFSWDKYMFLWARLQRSIVCVLWNKYMFLWTLLPKKILSASHEINTCFYDYCFQNRIELVSR